MRLWFILARAVTSFFATDMERVGARRRAASVHQVSARASTIPTRDDIPGRFSTRYLRRREHREVSAVPCELICSDRAIADGGQFAGPMPHLPPLSRKHDVHLTWKFLRLIK